MDRDEWKEKLWLEVGEWGVEGVLGFCRLQHKGKKEAEVITEDEVSG